jgi:hypothetical protein
MAARKKYADDIYTLVINRFKAEGRRLTPDGQAINPVSVEAEVGNLASVIDEGVMRGKVNAILYMTNALSLSCRWPSIPDDTATLTRIGCAEQSIGAETDRRQWARTLRRHGVGHEPTHWSFGQLATLAEAPAGYLRTLPSPMAADCINYGLQFKRAIEDVAILLSNNYKREVRAATGPRYGRIWNSEVTDSLVNRFGDAVTRQWRVPGEFGQRVQVNKGNTTLYAIDRDMFVFLADEENRIEVAGRNLARLFRLELRSRRSYLRPWHVPFRLRLL